MGKSRLIKLKNGAVIIYKRRNLCNASAVSVGFFVGHKDCFDTIPGLAHFMEHAMFLGTKKYTREQIKEKVSRLSVNAGTSLTLLTTDFYVSNKNLKEAFDLSSELLLNPIYPEEDIKNELKVVFEELEFAKTRLSHDFDYQHSKNLYGKTAYDPIKGIGTEDCLGKVTSDDLIKFREKYFTLDNFVISITTSLPYWKVKRMINRYFLKNIQNPHCPSDHDRHYHYELSEPKIAVVNDESLSVYKVLISNIFKSKKEEFLYDSSLHFINWFNNRYINNFVKKARKEGLIYTASQNISKNSAYEFSFDDFYFQTSKLENIDKIINLINENIRYIKSKPITKNDLKQFINEEYIDNDKSFPISYEKTKNRLLDQYSNLDKLNNRTFKKRIKEMKTITIQHVNEIIDRIYNQNNQVYITIMGKTDGQNFKSFDEYKKMMFE